MSKSSKQAFDDTDDHDEDSAELSDYEEELDAIRLDLDPYDDGDADDFAAHSKWRAAQRAEREGRLRGRRSSTREDWVTDAYSQFMGARSLDARPLNSTRRRSS